jgi:replicative DNA helicase
VKRPFATVTDLFAGWRADVLSDDPPACWSIGDPTFEHVEVVPGRIVLLGGAPGSGKTALLMQWSGGILASEADARIMIANVEMSPGQLLCRMLSRLSRVNLTAILKRQVMPEEYSALGNAMEQIQNYGDRLAFATTPSDFEAVRGAVAAHRADILIVDYLQRVNPPGKSNGMRERINLLMSELRRLADCGVAVLAAAALTRSRDGKGKATYAGPHLSIASFRESGELEYGADSAYLLFSTDEDDKRPIRSMLLKQEKNRDGETKDTALAFNRPIQQFSVDPFLSAASPSPSSGARVREAWGKASQNGKNRGSENQRPD